MSSPERPPVAVRAWRRRPLYLALPLLALFVVLVVVDRSTHAELSRYAIGEHQVRAYVRDGLPGWSVAGWYEPSLETELRLELAHTPQRSIAMMSRPEDPFDSRPIGSTLAGDPSRTLTYLVWLLPPWIWWATRWWTVRRAASLAGSASSAPMLGCFAQVRGRTRPVLHLYAADSVESDPPRCSVPVIGWIDVVRTAPFPVDAVGPPGPRRRVVVRDGDGTIWPSGRTLLWTRCRRPASTSAAVARSASWVPTILVLLLSVAGVTSATIAETHAGRDAAAAQRSGVHVAATITRRIDEYTFHITYPIPGEPGVTAAAELITVDEVPQRRGEQVDVVLRSKAPMRPYLYGDVYDSAAGIVIAVTAAAIALFIAISIRGLHQRALEPFREGWVPGRSRHVEDRGGRSFGGRSSVPWSRLHAFDGVLRGPVSFIPWRPRLTLDRDGLTLVFRGGPERYPWSQPWSLQHFQGRGGSVIQVHVGGAVRTVGGHAWQREYVQALDAVVACIRDDPAARRGMADPTRVAVLADELNAGRWRRPRRGRPWFAAGDVLDDVIAGALERAGGEVVAGYLVGGHPPFDVAQIVEDARAQLARSSMDDVPIERIRGRVMWWLRGPVLPLDVLRGTSPSVAAPSSPPPSFPPPSFPPPSSRD